MRHTKARNAIERAFGVMNKRWEIILRSATYYRNKIQTKLIIACFFIHNFIHNKMVVDPFEQQSDAEHNEHGNNEDHEDINFIDVVEPISK